MEVIIPSEPNEEKDARSRAEVLHETEPAVADLMEQHLSKRRLWFPSDFLPTEEQEDEDEKGVIARMRERARGIADAVRVSVALGLLTEEGLPHFHRMLSRYLGDESVWIKWNFLWTAEEDRHGAVLRDYARESRLFKFREIELLQHAYNEAGFNPDWDKDPYKVFVYTTLQERATQVTHMNTGKMGGVEEPVLKGILSNVAADEAKHFSFYRSVFKRILEIDPNRALESALAILPAIEMPGVSMPHFREMADVVRRTGIYGPWDYKKIVEEAIAFWNIESLTGLNDVGRKAQEKIMAIPKRLQKVAEYIESRSSAKSFSFAFLYDREFAME